MSRAKLVLLLGAALAAQVGCGGLGYGEDNCYYPDYYNCSDGYGYVNGDVYPVYFTDEYYDGQGGLYYAPYYNPDTYNYNYDRYGFWGAGLLP